MLATQAHPTEWSVTIVEKLRPHNVFHIAGENKAILVILFFGNLPDSGIVDGFHKGVAIIKEISSTLHKCFYRTEVTYQRFIHQPAEFLRIFMQQVRTFLKCQSHRTITAFVSSVAGGLVGKQINMYSLIYGIFQQIDNITMIGNGDRPLAIHRFASQ